MTHIEIYEVLSLFGAQKSIGAIPNIKIRSGLDESVAVLSFGEGDYCDSTDPGGTCGWDKNKADYVCADDGIGEGYECQFSFGDVCLSTCK